MDLIDDILSASLQKYFKRYTEGDFLFRQGEMASTLYFLVNGRLQLITERPDGDSVESVLETGQFLGEKVLVQPQPYKRAFSARCDSDVLLLELNQDDFADIEANDPAVMTDLLRTILKVVGGRFELVNLLARGLRTNDDVARIGNVIRYFSKNAAAGHAGGVFVLSEDAILKYVETDRKTVRSAIRTLLEKGLLVRADVTLYSVPDDEALSQFIAAR